MCFNIRSFLENPKSPYTTSFFADFSKSDFDGYQVPDAVECTFEAQPTMEGAELTLRVSATIVAECARCLQPLTQQYAFTRDYSLRLRDLDDPDFELPLNEKGALDLTELAYQEVVLEVPRVLLCSADCKGLCPICGKSKAAGCSCQMADEAAPADARLGILKQLLS